jgi:starch phosphorylase
MVGRSSPEVAWALGDGKEHTEPEWDANEADAFYSLLEREVVPTFYERDVRGIPQGWLAKMCASMARLTARFSSNRMVREYVENYYIPAAREFQHRTDANGRAGIAIEQWRRRLAEHWQTVHFGNLSVSQSGSSLTFDVQVYLSEIDRADVQVQLFADAVDGESPIVSTMQAGERLAGATNGFTYRATVAAGRPSEQYTPRIVPEKAGVSVPLEASQILWFR